MPDVIRGGVPLVTLEDGRTALVITPGDAVMVGDTLMVTSITQQAEGVLEQLKQSAQDAQVGTVGALKLVYGDFDGGTHWLPCDGKSFDRNVYKKLFAQLGKNTTPILKDPDVHIAYWICTGI